MVDPTSDLGDDTAEECATCGESIVSEPTHRVVTWVENGTVNHRHFCDDDCLDAWNDER